MTYRVGTHHGVTICREGDDHHCGRDGHDCTRGHLVAVVVDGDVELAERICALLNADDRCWHGEHCDGSGPDCERDAPLKGGHRDCAAAWHANHGCATEPYDLNAPSGPPSLPVSAEQPPVGGNGRPEGVEVISAARERFTVQAVTPYPGTADVTIHHDCRAWWVDIADPITLAELNQRADEHTEVCR